MIEVLTEVTSQDTEDLNSLARQIMPTFENQSTERWQTLVRQESVAVVVYREPENRRIIAMGTVIVPFIPTRTKAYIEDVVTDEQYRRKGIGTQIEGALVDIAQETGAPVAYLTSSRPDAKAMWERLGWGVGATTAYFKKTS